MISCSCDYDPPVFYHAARPLARVSHKCHECERTIQPGERYERVRAMWEDEPVTLKTCVYCLAMRDLVDCRAECFCWAHGNLVVDIKCLTDELPDGTGLRMAVGRIVIERKRA